MNYGEVFAKVLTDALKREEEELHGLAANGENSRQTVKSVKEYYESWLSVPLTKEALRNSCVPRLEWEKDRVDIKFLGDGDKPVATFEIKFENVSRKPDVVRRIVKDFRKQSEVVLSDKGSAEHYCVLVLCGDRQDVEGWQPTELQELVKDRYPSIRLTLIRCPEYLELNAGGCLGVFAIRVAQA